MSETSRSGRPYPRWIRLLVGSGIIAVEAGLVAGIAFAAWAYHGGPLSGPAAGGLFVFGAYYLFSTLFVAFGYAVVAAVRNRW